MSGDAPSENNRRPGPAPCVICGKPVTERFRPFCSKRCADVDLQRWFSESYVIAGEQAAPGRDGAEED